MVEVRLLSSAITAPTSVRIKCNQVLVSGTKNTTKKPDANGTNIVEVQTQSFENPKIVLQGVHFDGGADTLTYKNMLELYKLNYNGSNAPVLRVSYGTSNNLISASDLATTDIPVVMESFNFPISVTDSKNGYMPVGSITFTETL